MNRPLTVYRQVRTERRRCSLGEDHTVWIYEAKVIYPTDRTWHCNNGYDVSTQPVYVDGDGTEYRRYVTIDYSNNVSYVTSAAVGSDAQHWSEHRMKPNAVESAAQMPL